MIPEKTVREQIMDEMEAKFRKYSTSQQVMTFSDVICYVGDMDIILLAQSMGIDTNAFYFNAVKP